MAMPDFSQLQSVRLFRSSAPYINAHRGKTFVLMFGGEAFDHKNFANIIHDIALLSSLGVRLVLVHGARPQIDERVALRHMESQFVDEIRVTDKPTLEAVKDAAGSVRAQIEALLTMGLPNSPMHGAQIRVCGGNHVVAQPMGVKQGVDFENTGVVRRIDTEAIHDHLNDGSIVLLSPIGYSPTGEVFNLSHEDVATQAAISLKADKFIAFSEQVGVFKKDGGLLRTMQIPKFNAFLADNQLTVERTVSYALSKTVTAGVTRAHCVSYQQDGALLQELFTRDGAGTLILHDNYEHLRTATIDDVGGILRLIKPLEENGILVKRSRERLEREIQQFVVVERDGMIIGCAALYLYPKENCAELACVATHREYRGKSRGVRILDEVKARTVEAGISRLFVLTTVTAHWFLEQGFTPASLDSLPQERQALYNFQRNSKVFEMTL